MVGKVRTTCPICGQQQKVEVEFPLANKGFNDRVFKCEKCEIVLWLCDAHVYQKDGRISNEED